MIELPMPPSLNRLYATTRFGGIYKNKIAKDYATEVGWLLKGQKPIEKDKCVEMTIIFYVERKNADIDNRLKVLMDACQGYLYENDKQVNIMHLYKMTGDKKPRVELSAKEIN